MTRRYFFILFLFLCAFYIHFSDVSFDSFLEDMNANNPTSYVTDQGHIQVYFCPHQDCVGPLVNFIDSATTSVHCAFFELDLEEVQHKILAKKEQGVDVKVVTDEQYLYEFNHSFVVHDSWGLMHNKFCIVDGQRISSGSMNPTNNGAHKNDNNLIFIESVTLAQNYEAEFNEMYAGIFKGGDTVNVPHVKMGTISVYNYMCPEDNCKEKVKEILAHAKESIYFMTFSFTHQEIANILFLQHLDGVDVKGVFEARQVSKHSVYERLLANNMNVVKDGNKANMHHKVFLIDEKIVITGSMNPSKGGDTKNDENVLIIEDEKIAKKYKEEFDRVWDEAKAAGN